MYSYRQTKPRFNKDISTYDGTLGKAILARYSSIMESKTKEEAQEKVAKLLEEEKIDTPASRKFKHAVETSKSYVDCLQTVANYMLAAKGMAVFR